MDHNGQTKHKVTTRLDLAKVVHFEVCSFAPKKHVFDLQSNLFVLTKSCPKHVLALPRCFCTCLQVENNFLALKGQNWRDYRPKTTLYEARTMFLKEILTKMGKSRCNYDHQMFPPISEASYYFLPFIIEIQKVQTLSECPSETDF